MSTNTKAAEMLEQVNSAISAVLAGGQSYKIDSGTDNCLLDRTFVAFFDGR